MTVELPPDGEPLFYRSTIRSDARLTYGQAERRDVPEGVLDALALNDELAQRLRARRFARGALQVQSPEVVFRFDGSGGVADAWLESEPHAHVLVEELMILANEQVGGLLASRNREALYRVHERPDPVAIEHLLAKLADLGVPTPPAPERMTPAQAATLAGAISERVDGVRRAVRPRPLGVHRARSALAQAGALRPAQPRPLGSCEPRLLPFHLADPPLPGPGRAPSPAARARRLRRPAARRARFARGVTRRRASERRRRSSTSQTTSAWRGCSSAACSSAAGTSPGRGRSRA